MIIENGDSLWIRVNVEDFKESLTFSGKGSSKNNFLVDISNLNDYENEILLVVFQQRNHPSDFSQNSGYSKKGFFDKFLWFVQ